MKVLKRVDPVRKFAQACLQVAGSLEAKLEDWGFQCLIFGYVVGRMQEIRGLRKLDRITREFFRLWDAFPEQACRFLLGSLTGYLRGRRWAV